MADRRGQSAGEGDWAANWIWCQGESRPRNFYLYARRAFNLPAKPARASIRITADSRYKLFVNGGYVGRGPVRSVPRRQFFDTYDISARLDRGENVIAVLVHHIGQGTYSYIPGRAGLICQADIEWDGGREKIVTDGTWRVLHAEAWTPAGGRMSRRLGFQEVYDARLEPAGWTQPRFGDASWPQAIVIGKPPMEPFGRLVERQIPHLREGTVYPAAVVSAHDCAPLPAGIEPPDIPHYMAVESLAPLKEGRVHKPERLLSPRGDETTVGVPQSGGVSLILDFGREVFGSVELAFAYSHGGIVDIGYSECLDQGRVKPDKEDVRYTDRIVLRKGGQTWCSFEQRGFRYMQLDFRNCPKPVSISHVLVRETSYPVEWRGSFECSDPLLNQIWKVAAETVRLCMQDSYIDSPWREQAQWWDNAYVASRVASYVFGDTALLAQGLRHIAASQEQSGAVLALYPSATKEIFPDFGALWVMSTWDCYAASLDRKLLSELYPAIACWLRWIGRFRNSDNLLSRVEGDLFIDWGEIDRRGEVAALNLLYLGALRAAARTADVLGKVSDAEELAELAHTVRMAVDKHFWSPSRGLYADATINGKLQDHYSRQTNALAVLFDVPDHYQKASIARQLIDDGGLPHITTPYFTSFLVEALCLGGYASEGIDLIRDKWGRMISEGATTFWEFFTPEGSLCQASASGPGYQLQAYVLGVKLGGNRVHIEPQPADLHWANGVVPTARGPVTVDWRAGRSGLSMKFEVPDGLTAVVVPPRRGDFTRVLFDERDVSDVAFEAGPGVHELRVVSESFARLRRRVQVGEIGERPEPVPIPPERGDLVYVEQMIKILSELEKEQPEARPAEAAGPSVEKRRRPRRRRSAQSARAREAEGGRPGELETSTGPGEHIGEAAPPASHRRRRPGAVPDKAAPGPRGEAQAPSEARPSGPPAGGTEKTAEGSSRRPRRRARRPRKRTTSGGSADSTAAEG